jgi:hypothetical protein
MFMFYEPASECQKLILIYYQIFLFFKLAQATTLSIRRKSV